MPDWPNTIPDDLRKLLTSTMSARNVGPAEVWGDLRDWLIKHGVQAPEVLPERDPVDPDMNQ